MKTLESLEELTQIKADHPVVGYYFSTPTCGVCHTWKPQIENAFQQHDFPIIHIDLTEFPMVTGEFMVMGVPTLVIHSDGREQFRFGAYDRMFEMVERVNRMMEMRSQD